MPRIKKKTDTEATNQIFNSVNYIDEDIEKLKKEMIKFKKSVKRANWRRAGKRR